METGRASRTAASAARYRAAHQVLEEGRIFADPLAVPILGVAPDDLRADEPRRAMRFFVSARSRFAEDALAAAVASRGISQLVVLGAGLDTFGYRNPYPALRVFEVDHPDTQAWKRERLAEGAIAVPPGLTYVGVDLEREPVAAHLRLDGPAFFFWLGVVPYLTRPAFDETLGFVAAGHGNEVVFDYAQSPERMPAERRAFLEARAARVAGLGEPWLTYSEPDEIDTELRSRGFTDVEDVSPALMAARYFDRPDVPPDTPGGHLVRAVRP
jgi:methyltransferase (TIGR00027 family)